jgi:hypothetical protein
LLTISDNFFFLKTVVFWLKCSSHWRSIYYLACKEYVQDIAISVASERRWLLAGICEYGSLRCSWQVFSKAVRGFSCFVVRFRHCMVGIPLRTDRTLHWNSQGFSLDEYAMDFQIGRSLWNATLARAALVRNTFSELPLEVVVSPKYLSLLPIWCLYLIVGFSWVNC